jgi:hypothetical protein
VRLWLCDDVQLRSPQRSRPSIRNQWPRRLGFTIVRRSALLRMRWSATGCRLPPHASSVRLGRAPSALEVAEQGFWGLRLKLVSHIVR